MHEKGKSIFEYALEFARLSFQCITVHFAHYSSVLAKAQLQQHLYAGDSDKNIILKYISKTKEWIWECF